jgi:peptide/nickel transport system permease protein
MVPTLVIVSIISFIVIQLPPGDFLSSYVAQLRQEGDSVDEMELEMLRQRYGLGQPVYVQLPVKELIWERMALTVVLSTFSLLVSWFVAIPIGIYSATHQYSILDYALSIMSFIGVGTPGFMLAMVVMWVALSYLGMSVGGLFSDAFINAPWLLEAPSGAQPFNWPKVVDMLKHLWIPVLILAVNGTAGSIRTTRANLLDELHKPYVITARAKGVKENRLIWKYPVRVAMNPFFSTVGWSLARLISGGTLLSVVLSLQTTGPLMLRALTSQDMYLAGSFLLLLSTLTVIGTLISDILLAWVDPRIRLQG